MTEKITIKNTPELDTDDALGALNDAEDSIKKIDELINGLQKRYFYAIGKEPGIDAAMRITNRMTPGEDPEADHSIAWLGNYKRLMLHISMICDYSEICRGKIGEALDILQGICNEKNEKELANYFAAIGGAKHEGKERNRF